MTLSENTPLETQQESSPEQNKLFSSPSITRRTLFAKSFVVGTGIMGLTFLDGHTSAFAASLSPWQAVHTAHIAQSTTQLHSCGRATDGRIFHTIRISNSSWQSFFGNVNDQESNGNALRFTDVDCAGVVDTLHVTALARNGVIWHTIRFGNGSWQSSFGNVNNQESNGHLLHFSNVSCAGTMSNMLHLTALTRDGVIWHTIRFANGSWQSFFGNVNDQESNGNALHFTDVDGALIGEDLHVCGIDRNGTIWHTIRFANGNGSWQSSFGNVNNQESNGNSLRFTTVGCASIGDTLHITALDTDGVIWHTIRFANGSWQSFFGNVNNQESNGNSLRFTDVDCANVANTLHVTAIDQSNIIWHTIRLSNSSWQSFFGNVNNQESNGNSLRFTALGAGGVV